MNIAAQNIKRPIADMDDSTAQTVISALNNLLANEYALFTKTLNYHWNITGPRFLSMHEFMEDQYKDTLTIMDSVAERIRVLGETPISTVQGFNKEMDLSERSGKDMSCNEMIADLFTSNMRIQSFIKTTISEEALFKKDPGTEDFLVGVLQKHEMTSWMLKSHLD